jgi:hypothetical protein
MAVHFLRQDSELLSDRFLFINHSFLHIITPNIYGKLLDF